MTQLALVGSGEYLPSMVEFEKLISREGKYVQIALAAGKEGERRLNYWKELGEVQAKRLGMEPYFVPVFNRKAAEDFNENLLDAGLIYFSGGDPGYLVQSIKNTKLLDSVLQARDSGIALAGCSAGAMMMGQQVLGLSSFFTGAQKGLGLIEWNVIPHYDKFGKYFSLPLKMDKSKVIGIDEETALYKVDGHWKVWGKGYVHIGKNKYGHDELILK
jgi:cyanophycinase